MVRADSLFIVIEGLDGSGKSTAGKELAIRLKEFLGGKVRLSAEPNEACCGGIYIRQVLEKKISRFSYETLAYAFAANRKDHGDRRIKPWLEKGGQHIFISDRYYLSSLVYQSNDKFSIAQIMELNQYAIQPDVTFFLSVTPEICLQRMGVRNKPKELFEENFLQTQQKYQEAISYLREHRNEQIIEIDASGSLQQVVEKLAEQVSLLGDSWSDFLSFVQAQENISVNQRIEHQVDQLPLTVQQVQTQLTSEITLQSVANFINTLTRHDKESVLLDLLLRNGYALNEQVNIQGGRGFELTFLMPGGMEQKGGVLIVDKSVGLAPIMQFADTYSYPRDFIFVIDLWVESHQNSFFERDVYVQQTGEEGLFPKVKFFGKTDIIDWLFKTLTD